MEKWNLIGGFSVPTARGCATAARGHARKTRGLPGFQSGFLVEGIEGDAREQGEQGQGAGQRRAGKGKRQGEGVQREREEEQ